jgi:hypothetical protein
MRTFKFTIADAKLFTGEAQFSSEEAAWQEALRLVRDIETSLKPREGWVLTVSEDEQPIFRISIATEDLRAHSKSPTG